MCKLANYTMLGSPFVPRYKRHCNQIWPYTNQRYMVPCQKIFDQSDVKTKDKKLKESSVLWCHTLLRYFLFLWVQRCFIMKTTGPGSWPTRSRSRKGSSRSLGTRKTIAALMKTISSRFVPFALWDNFMSAWLVKSFPNSPVGNDDLSYSILRLAVSAE